MGHPEMVQLAQHYSDYNLRIDTSYRKTILKDQTMDLFAENHYFALSLYCHRVVLG